MDRIKIQDCLISAEIALLWWGIATKMAMADIAIFELAEIRRHDMTMDALFGGLMRQRQSRAGSL